MNCPTCYGKGFVREPEFVVELYPSGREENVYVPCPTCKGYGTVHCCDGENVDMAARND